MNTIHPARAARLSGLTTLIICLLAATLVGCKPAPTATPTATLLPTNTSVPTATHTATPTNTPTPTATPDRTATAMFRATSTMAARVAELATDLEAVGFTTDSGSLVYDSAAPVAMTVDRYNSYWPEPVYSAPLKNFILHVDVRWDSTSGLAGCGIMFRAEDDLVRGAHYAVELMRLQNAPAWGMFYYKFNRNQANLVSARSDTTIDDQPNAVNNVILVVQGDVLQTYINGKKMREARYSKIQEGGIAFYTWQESGETTCAFKNTWVWGLTAEAPTPAK